MKTVLAALSTLALVTSASALVGCAAEATSPEEGTSEDNVATTVGRATLDGYWKRVDESSVVGITFNKCIGLDGRAEVRLGTDTATCKAGMPDVGSYTIHGKEGAPVETGTYRIGRLSQAGKRGAITFFQSGKTTSYPLEYDLSTAADKSSSLRLAKPGAADANAYRAEAASVPKSCDPASPKRISGEAFLGEVDFNWFRHGYTAGQRGDEVPFEKIVGSRPFRFGYPACDVQLRPGMADTDHVNAVCDGDYELAVGNATASVVWKERRTTMPRFFSLHEALHVLGGDGEGFRQTIGAVLTPLVDLAGADAASCEAKLAAAKAKDPSRSRAELVNETADNACKIVLADTKKLVVDERGRPRYRFVQVFDRAVFVSSGEANGDACLGTP